MPRATNDTALSTVLAGLGISAWDIALVGDGSGGGWTQPAGWACTLHDRATGGRRRFYGGLSTGSSALAELLPYVHALAWYDEYRRRGPRPGRVLNVHILCDNQALVGTGRALAAGTKAAAAVRANRPFWAALLAYERQGFALHYHWVRRDSVALNRTNDRLARACFRAMQHIVPGDDPYADNRTTPETTPDGT